MSYRRGRLFISSAFKFGRINLKNIKLKFKRIYDEKNDD